MQQYVRVEKDRLESAERRATSYFDAMLRANATNDKLRTALLAFIHVYANIERLDHDHVEIKLFEAWLKGCAVLGIKADPPARRQVE